MSFPKKSNRLLDVPNDLGHDTDKRSDREERPNDVDLINDTAELVG